MAIDASIYSQIRQPQQPDLIGQAGQFAQLQGAQQQNRLAAMQMQEYERKRTEEDAMREAVKGFGTDTTANVNRLMGTGNLKAATDYQKTITEQQKAQREAEKAKIEAQVQKLGFIGQTLTGVNDPMTYSAARQRIIQAIPEAASEMPEAFNPQEVETARSRSLTVKDQLEQKWKAMEYTTPNANARLQADTSIENNKRTVGAQQAIASANREQAQAARDAAKATADATRDSARIQTGFKNETDLRKEFADLPEVKRYKSAYPSYKAIEDAAKTNNPQADINLIYGLAKLYDPESVVREGEYATIANSQAIPERIKSIAQSLIGNGKLTPATKQQILAEARNRIATFENEYGKAKEGYTEIAKARGIDTRGVFTNVGGTAQPAATPAPAASPGAGNWGIQKVN